MKNIIRLTETQLTNMVKRLVNESTASESLKDMVKTDGWKETSKLCDAYVSNDTEMDGDYA